MKNKKSSNAGFIGLLALLIGVTILIFLMVRNMSLLQGNKTNTNNTSEQGTNNLSPIDSAKNAKDLIEQNNARAIEQLE